MKPLAHFTKTPLVAVVAIVLILSTAISGQSPPPLTTEKPAERQLNLLVLGDSIMWVLPNPSGLNAHYTPKDLARVFGEFRQRIELM